MTCIFHISYFIFHLFREGCPSTEVVEFAVKFNLLLLAVNLPLSLTLSLRSSASNVQVDLNDACFTQIYHRNAKDLTTCSLDIFSRGYIKHPESITVQKRPVVSHFLTL